MFDTPDLAPCCLAPIVTIGISVLIYNLGQAFDYLGGEKPEWSWRRLVSVIAILGALVAGTLTFALGIGERNPAPLFKPTTNNIAGTRILSANLTDRLPQPANMPSPAKEIIFYADGTFQANEIPDLWSYTDRANQNHIE